MAQGRKMMQVNFFPSDYIIDASQLFSKQTLHILLLYPTYGSNKNQFFSARKYLINWKVGNTNICIANISLYILFFQVSSRFFRSFLCSTTKPKRGGICARLWDPQSFGDPQQNATFAQKMRNFFSSKFSLFLKRDPYDWPNYL